MLGTQDEARHIVPLIVPEIVKSASLSSPNATKVFLIATCVWVAHLSQHISQATCLVNVASSLSFLPHNLLSLHLSLAAPAWATCLSASHPRLQRMPPSVEVDPLIVSCPCTNPTISRSQCRKLSLLMIAARNSHSRQVQLQFH